MSLLSADYNSGSSGNNSGGGDGDYEERPRLSMNNYAIASFVVSDLSEYTGDYGQNVYVNLDDVELMHGMFYDRTWEGPDGADDYDDKMMKLFGFGDWFDTNEDGTLAEEIDEKFINHRISEKFGSNKFPYEFVELVTEDEDPIEVGDMEMKLRNSTKNRTFLKVLTDQGHDVIDDKENDISWVNENNMTLRDDILGRRIVLFFKETTWTPDGQDEPVTYTDAVVLDAETGAGVTIQNGSSDSDSSDDSSSGTLGGDDEDDGLPEGVPEDADDIIDFMARTGETDPDQVDNLVGDEAEDYDLDAVVAEVERRM